MPETWIDEHTGHETTARPDFQAELRADLAAELASRLTRNAPWRAIGWASAVAAVTALVTVVAVSTNDVDRRVVPAESTSTSADPRTPTSDHGGSLRDRLVDVEWTVVMVDGANVTAERPPTFTLQNNGRLVGFDGCNQYGFDLSAAGGWTLTGDMLGLDQQMISTAMACPDGPNPVIPVADGTRLTLDASGLLTLSSPSGRIYIAQDETDVEPVADLLVPAEGGPLLAPRGLINVGIATDEGAPLVALLPDRIVVLPLEPFTIDGTVLSFDRAGNPLPDTQLYPIPEGRAGLALGGRDDTLYIVTNSDTDNAQTVRAYRLVGDVWREVDSTVIEQNNDGVFAVTGDGVTIGDTTVLPAPTPDPTAPRTGWITGDDGMRVFRTDADGSDTTWNIVEQFENFSIPAATNLFGDGVLFVGNASGTQEQRYLGILRVGGVSEFFRLDGWTLGGVDPAAALFVKAADGVVTLAVLDSAPQIDWASGTVLGFPIGFSSVDKLLIGVNPVYGEPTADSGWFTAAPTAPGDQDCLAGVEMRVLHWGDLTIAFKKVNTAEGIESELLWSWVVGDLRGSGFDSFREPFAAPAGTPTGLRTEGGFGLGTSTEALRRSEEVVLSDTVNSDGSRSGTFVPAADDGTSFRGLVVDSDGIVIGFGTTQLFC